MLVRLHLIDRFGVTDSCGFPTNPQEFFLPAELHLLVLRSSKPVPRHLALHAAFQVCTLADGRLIDGAQRQVLIRRFLFVGDCHHASQRIVLREPEHPAAATQCDSTTLFRGQAALKNRLTDNQASEQYPPSKSSPERGRGAGMAVAYSQPPRSAIRLNSHTAVNEFPYSSN